MTWQSVVITASPGAVFLRTDAPVTELEPGEVLLLIRQLEACVKVALGAADGRGVLRMMGPNNLAG